MTDKMAVMKRALLSHLVDPLRVQLEQWETYLELYRERSGMRVIGLACGMLPHEVLAAAGIAAVRIPASLHDGMYGCVRAENRGWAAASDALGVLDAVVVSSGCCRHAAAQAPAGHVVEFRNPAGYGEEAALALHESLRDLFARIRANESSLGDSPRLSQAVGEFNGMRRLVRGICGMRRERPLALTQDDLLTVMEAAACFPPSMIAEQAAVLLDALNGIDRDDDGRGIEVLAHGGMLADGTVLDAVEDAGCRVSEDDLCNGRRQFDVSYNAESTHVYAEILDAFSYRPLCPSIRPRRERIDLLYRLLRNHGIETVVFVGGDACMARKREGEGLRRELMRLGIDTVAATGEAAADAAGEYSRRVANQPMIHYPDGTR